MKYLLLLVFITNTLWAQPATPKAHKNGKYGYAKVDGSWLAKPKWHEARPFSENRAAVRKGDYWGFLDEKGKVLVRPRFSQVRDFHSGWAVVNGKQYLSLDGSYIRTDIENDPIAWADDFHGTVAFVRYESFWDKNAKNYTLIDNKGKILRPCIQSVTAWKNGRCKIGYYSNSSFAGSGDIYYVYLDSTNRDVSPVCRHDFDLEQAPVLVKNTSSKQTFLDQNGQPLIAWHDKIEVSKAGYIFATDYARINHQMVYTAQFQELIPKDAYKKVEFWSDTILTTLHAETSVQQFWATSQKQLLFQSQTPLQPMAQYFLFKNEKGWGLLRRDLQIVQQGLDKILEIQDGFLFCRQGKWGYGDTQGQERIAAQYDTLIATPENPLLLFRQQGKWGLVDRTGQLRLAPQYAHLAFLPGKTDAFEIREKNKTNWIDLSGKKLLGSGFEAIDYSCLSSGFLLIRADEDYGIADTKGKVIIRPAHDDIRYVEPIFIANSFIGNDYIFDKTGKKILEVEDLEYFYDPQTRLLLLEEKEDFRNDPQYCFFDLQHKKTTAISSCDNLDMRQVKALTWAIEGVIQIKTQSSFAFKDPDFYYFFQTNRGFWNRTCTKRTEHHSGKGEATAYNIFKFITVLPLLWDVAVGNDPITKPKSYTTTETDCIVERYKEVGTFSEGLIAVKDEKTGLWGYLNQEGKLAIPARFTTAGAFENGRAQVTENGAAQRIDHEGKVLANE